MVPKKECERIFALLEQFMDGELTEQDQIAVKEELATCEECRAHFDRLQKMRALVREVYVDEVRATDLSELLPGVMERIRSQPEGWFDRVANWLDKYRLGLASPVAPLGVAATLAVVIMAATLVYVSNNVPEDAATTPGRSAPAVAATEAVTPAESGESAKMAAAEGSDKKTEGSTAHDKRRLTAVGERRPRHEEKPFRKNECHITYYNVDSGIVIVDVDPDGDAPTVVWHFPEEGSPAGEEDNRI